MAKQQSKSSRKKKNNNRNIILFIIAMVVVIIVMLLLINYDIIPMDFLQSYISGVDTDKDTDTNKPSININPTGIGVGVVDIENFTEGVKTHFIDVGQGDCIFFELPDGKTMIIDNGNESRNNGVAVESIEYIKGLGYTTITYMMLTHADADHCSGLDNVIEEFVVENIYMPNILASHESVASADLPAELLDLFTDDDMINTQVYAKFFINALTEADVEIYLNIGEFTIKGTDYEFFFHCFDEEEWEANDLKNAEEKNEISPIGIFTYAGVSVVLTGDATVEAEADFLEDMGARVIDCDVLKVGHHGSDTSSSKEFLEYIDCEYAVICVGAENKYGHPVEDIAGDEGALYQSGIERIFCTDDYGTIVLYIDKDGNYNFATEITPEAVA